VSSVDLDVKDEKVVAAFFIGDGSDMSKPAGRSGISSGF
jgi:hypothetical protein